MFDSMLGRLMVVRHYAEFPTRMFDEADQKEIWWLVLDGVHDDSIGPFPQLTPMQRSAASRHEHLPQPFAKTF